MALVKKLVIGVVGLILGLLVVGFFLPRNVHLERSVTIDAPQHTVFTLLSGYGRFNEWSPWSKLDPETVYTFEGPSHGVGAAMAWTSDDPSVGSGNQRITALTVPSQIKTDLDFGPQGTADAFFNLEAEGASTRVTWGFDTDLGVNPLGRYFGLVLDSMLGPQYEEGLANLKVLAEELPKTDFAGLVTERVEVSPSPIAYFSGSSTQEQADIEEALGAAFEAVEGFLSDRGLEASGPPITVNKVWGEGVYAFDAALPLAQAPSGETGAGGETEVQIGTTWAGSALKTVHAGSWSTMEATYEQLDAYLKTLGWELAGPPWEIWLTDPESTPEDELRTEIYFPLAG
ncbi:MAG: SRPBCC family protein [Acidobacteriota bacterium]